MNLGKPFAGEAAAGLFLKDSRLIIRQDAADAIAFDQMNAKFHYDRKHQPMFMKQGDYALIKLHKDYNIPFAASRKYSQQFVNPFQIIEKVGRLAYRLNIPDTWRIHPVFSVAQLESCPPPKADPFQRFRPDHSKSVYVDENTNNVKSFELLRIINKRKIKIKDTEYLIQWKDYGLEHNAWKNFSKLSDAMDLIKEYEDAARTTTIIPGKIQSAAKAPKTKSDRAKKYKSPPPELKKPFATSSAVVTTRKPSVTSSAVATTRKLSATSSAVAITRKPFATNSAVAGSTSDLIPHDQRFAVVIPFKPVSSALVQGKPFATSSSDTRPSPATSLSAVPPPPANSGLFHALIRRSSRLQ